MGVDVLLTGIIFVIVFGTKISPAFPWLISAGLTQVVLGALCLTLLVLATGIGMQQRRQVMKYTVRLGRLQSPSNLTKTPVFGNAICYGCETKTGVVRILVIFQDRPMLSHINGKPSPRPIESYSLT